MCSIELCAKPVKARGWCNAHYQRQRKAGDPTILRRQHPHGPDHGSWRGGLTISRGYRYIRQPRHPRAGHFKYVREHILIAERALGHPLSRGVEIHHVDGDSLNNAPNNLVICPDHAYHRLLHVLRSMPSVDLT